MDFSKWQKDDYKEWQDMCMHCGNCVGRGPMIPHNNQELPPHEWQSPDHKCPSFEYYNFKAYTGMGHLLLSAQTWRNNEEFSDDRINIMYQCASCGMCDQLCPTYQPMHVMYAARQDIFDRGCKLPEPLPELFDNMDKTQNLFGLENRAKPLPYLPDKAENVYFTGCYTSYLLPRIAHINARLLLKGGVDICHFGEEEHCCGEVAKQGGNNPLFKKLAEDNVQRVIDAGAKRVIVSCAHCYRTWKEDYPNVLQKDLPFEVVHVTEVLAELIKEGRLKPEKPIERTVTYHDPCGLRGKVNQAPRDILESIPGLTLNEMERYGRWSYCCGSGAKIAQNCYPDFAAFTGKERALEAKEAADSCITACPVCYNQMRYTANSEEIDLSVEDISELLAESVGISTKLYDGEEV